MTLGSSIETVAILYDIENAPFEMLDYTLGKARKYLPCRMIIVSDWEKKPNQKRWNRLLRRTGFTFRQIDRKIDGKNSLDYALFDTAAMMRDEGVHRFFIITTDSDFIHIANELKKNDTSVQVIGVGTEQASDHLREDYDEFICYPAEPRMKKKEPQKAVKDTKKKIHTPKKQLQTKAVVQSLARAASVDNMPNVSAEEIAAGMGNLQVQLPKTLHEQLVERMKSENVDMSQLVTYLLMKGIMAS